MGYHSVRLGCADGMCVFLQARSLQSVLLQELFVLGRMLLSNPDYVSACEGLVGRRVCVFNGVFPSSTYARNRKLASQPDICTVTAFDHDGGERHCPCCATAFRRVFFLTKRLALRNSGEIALVGSRRLRSTLAAAPVLFSRTLLPH